jgi:DNA-binding MarR family transcriptional regulator
MSSERLSRTELLNEIVYSLERELSSKTVLFHAAIAEKLGLSGTDHKALDLIYKAGSMTAGQLAELTGLTTGAVTGIVDRLEEAGFARRTRASHDRRQVIIEPIPEQAQKIHQLFESLGQSMSALTEQYSDQELTIIHRYLIESIRVVQAETAKLQSNSAI